jgi:hypothetical protein
MLVVNEREAEFLKELGAVEGRDFVVSPSLPLDDHATTASLAKRKENMP